MFRIGEFSKLSQTTIKALRYYDEVGLLRPGSVDKWTGYRFYTTDQLLQAHRIRALRQVGLSIEEIRLLLSGRQVQEILEKRRAELLTEIDERNTQLSHLIFLEKQEDYFMQYAATRKDLPACIVYSKRMVAPSFAAYATLIPAVGEQVKKQYPDLKCTTPEYCYITYLDSEYRETDIRIEYCEAVTELRENFDDIVFKQLPSVPAVSVMHKGSYDGLSQAYAYAFRWIEENDCIAVGSPREHYIDGIWNRENPADWLTEIQIPIADKSEITDKYGDTDAYKQSSKKDRSPSQQTAMQKDADAIFKAFAEQVGNAPDSPAVQALVARWQAHITTYYYDCTKEILASLGQMYTADARFTENIDRFAVGTAALMSSAIAIYCS